MGVGSTLGHNPKSYSAGQVYKERKVEESCSLAGDDKLLGFFSSVGGIQLETFDPTSFNT